MIAAPIIDAVQNTTVEVEAPRLYLNGFPKSGLHLADLMAKCIARPLLETKNWLGNIKQSAWGSEMMTVERVEKILDKIPAGAYIKGHMAYDDAIKQALLDRHFSVILIYRDLRDVVVSQAHHILNENDERFKHPGKELYRSLGSFENILEAVINGIDCYPGVFDRWKLFEPWAQLPWVYKMRFADMVERPNETAGLFIRYVYGRAASSRGMHLTLNRSDYEEQVRVMVKVMQIKETATFRKGKTGGWKEEFTPKIIELFEKKAEEYNYGYES